MVLKSAVSANHLLRWFSGQNTVCLLCGGGFLFVFGIIFKRH